MDQNQKKHIKSLIGDASSSTRDLENLLMDECGADRKDVLCLLIWWFDRQQKGDSTEDDHTQKRNPESSKEILFNNDKKPIAAEILNTEELRRTPEAKALKNKTSPKVWSETTICKHEKIEDFTKKNVSVDEQSLNLKKQNQKKQIAESKKKVSFFIYFSVFFFLKIYTSDFSLIFMLISSVKLQPSKLSYQLLKK